MKTRTEYRAKVTDDAGLTRARVPHPILRELKARAGDYVTFNLNSGKATLRLSRKKSTKRR
ncbi:MAG TPA: hypothetical protein VF791_01255 [Pyrinomonadaceae bacterium]